MGYWDTPDNENCFEKTWITTKVATALSLVGSAYYFTAFPPESAVAAVQKLANVNLTMAGLGAIFGITTCVAAQIREAPDEPLNYFIGGCASGVLLGVKTHNAMTGTSACLALGALGFLGKASIKEEWRLIGPPRA